MTQEYLEDKAFEKQNYQSNVGVEQMFSKIKLVKIITCGYGNYELRIIDTVKEQYILETMVPMNHRNIKGWSEELDSIHNHKT